MKSVVNAGSTLVYLLILVWLEHYTLNRKVLSV